MSPPKASVPSAWTPGPWLVHATNRLVCQAEGAFKKVKVKNGKVLGDDLPNNICLLRDPGEDFSEDETLANGFLIAAAPELYHSALAFLEAYNEGGDDEALAPLVIELGRALRKARGETL